ncbi:MAG TPA: glutamate-5-semialdehyde dehydrogenase [Candidatus Syntrophoarchaeum butanivorans]|uniref:Gamma-glutamyl phosphate reductase n=1 Tax=Candidatus Syntropharchaeum butanivorans TaxID=1839936 RepID=A0A1F2P891_9EURY|nr:MAG: glutamate-5-semialdehyde dehydrogenase [Candidatus Syntrophoarchaeum butanivorans]HEC56338.1 glutamate-5-semialdehyde dehydrogenase [Candidatus Syntrophoarchaeum butanivorans]
MSIEEQAKLGREAALRLASASTDAKNNALERIARNLDENRGDILEANEMDVKEAKKANLTPSLIKRLELSDKKIDDIIEGVRSVIGLEDPVGKVLMTTELDESLTLYKVSTPIGLIGVIFESRPDALVQISTLCLKSGNAAILKGGSEAKNSNRVLFNLIKDAIEEDAIFKDAIQLVETREDVRELLKLDEYIDLMIPRGSNTLVRYIQENTKIPVLGHSDGICHVYVDKDADLKMAVDIAFDAKCQYAAVCNAMETLLVHSAIADAFLAAIKTRYDEQGVEIRGDERVRAIIECAEATDEDWVTEYNDLILSIKVVDSLDDAIDHINRYGSHHTDAIVTADERAAERFLNEVDSSSVMWNCSTRFSDGYRYGFGAEVGISTNKIHARGPVGLDGLTIYKYKLIGNGQVVEDYVEGRKKFTHRRLV